MRQIFSPPLVATSAPASIGRSAGVSLGVLTVGLGLFGVLFHAEVGAAVRVWIDSTAYNHCFLVLPIAAWLAWDRRDRLAQVALSPAPFAVLFAIPLALAWFVAERLGFMEGRQLAALGLVEILFLTVLGWPVFRAFAAPLLYLVFLVPFAGFLEPALQTFTARFVVTGLGLLGIPHSADGDIIRIPEGAFYIAPACAGLRFLIAAVAFGALYGLVMYRSPVRRVLFLAAAVAVPVIANGLRALGLVVLGHQLGSAEAAAVDHVLYGWLFFSLVLLLLALLGAVFREDRAVRRAWISPPRRPAPTSKWLAAEVALGVIAGAGPLASTLLERAAAAEPAIVPADVVPARGCAFVPEALGGKTALPVPAGAVVAEFACAASPVSIWIESFPPATAPKPILLAEAAAMGVPAEQTAIVSRITAPGLDPPSWPVIATDDPPRATASALWIEGRPAAGLMPRLRQAWNSIAGGVYRPVLVVVETDQGGEQGIRAIRAFLEREPGLGRAIARLASPKPRHSGAGS